ncbi:MAG: hypothetical protein GY822_13740 [Deltaproteobacteria bacterium]|nr:hypothetical protein [Deltaproteobacteria bacterium]
MAVEVRSQRQSHRFHSMKLLGGHGHGRSGDVTLNVTALVDMMMVLVIFLVMNFNASGEMLFLSKDMKMALAENGLEVTRVPIVAISYSDPDRCKDVKEECIAGNGTRALYFEGILLVSLADLDENDLRIPELEEKLVENRTDFFAIGGRERAEALAAEEDPTQTVNVQIHKKTDFEIIKRVLHTCELAGYGRIRFTMGDGKRADGAEGEAGGAGEKEEH